MVGRAKTGTGKTLAFGILRSASCLLPCCIAHTFRYAACARTSSLYFFLLNFGIPQLGSASFGCSLWFSSAYLGPAPAFIRFVVAQDVIVLAPLEFQLQCDTSGWTLIAQITKGLHLTTCLNIWYNHVRSGFVVYQASIFPNLLCSFCCLSWFGYFSVLNIQFMPTCSRVIRFH